MSTALAPPTASRGRLATCSDACRLVRYVDPETLIVDLGLLHDAATHDQGVRVVTRPCAVCAERAATPPPAPPVTVGPLTVDEAHHRVIVDGLTLRLTLIEARILFLLARTPDVVVPRRDVFAVIWRGAPVPPAQRNRTPGDVHRVSVHLVRLRRQLGAAGALVETVPGVGVRLRTGAPLPAGPALAPTGPSLAFGGLTMAVDGAWAAVDGRLLAVGPLERAVLRVLVAAEGAPVGRERLAAVGPENWRRVRRPLNAAVIGLRDHLAPYDLGIAYECGAGWRLVAGVPS